MRAAGDDGILQNVAEGEHIKILRADYFTNEDDEHFISVEGKSDQGRTDALTVRWDSGPGTEMGSGGSTTLSPFVDAGQYLYHRRQIEVDGRPDKVELSSAATGERLEGAVEDWAPPTDETGNPEIIDFTDPADPYLDPTQAYDRIKQLAQEFPNITELIELPYQTNGYRRKAQAQFGDTEQPGSVVVVESKNYGSEGGNNVRVTLRDPGAADQDLSVDVNRDTIVVNLETDEAGEIDSAAADVVEAINERVAAPRSRSRTGAAWATASSRRLRTRGSSTTWTRRRTCRAGRTRSGRSASATTCPATRSASTPTRRSTPASGSPHWSRSRPPSASCATTRSTRTSAGC